MGHAIQHLAHLLPAQGPIGVFIHHNTLHSFQHLPFEKAVVDAARIYQSEPYMQESAFRQALQKGRIREEDIEAVIAREGKDTELRRLMLHPGIRTFRPETIRWELEENALADTVRPDLPSAARLLLAQEKPQGLFAFWLSQTTLPEPGQQEAVRPRDGLLALHGEDSDAVINPLLIKLAGAFLDQGLAYWPMPNRHEGFWRASLEILRQPFALNARRLRSVSKWCAHFSSLSGDGAVREALRLLGVQESECEAMLQGELLALPGWAGLFAQLQNDPTLAPHEAVPASLTDFLAVRLLLTVAVVSEFEKDLQAWRVPVQEQADFEALRLVRAATLFDAAQLMGYTANQLLGWSAARRDAFVDSVLAFDDFERRRVWQLAYERRHERMILLPLQQHAAQPRKMPSDRLAAQVMFCIDDREESIRRHLEEVDPEIETFGAAGFFGVAMNYLGIDDARGSALCPVVVKPAHGVSERPSAGHEAAEGRRQSMRRAWARITREWFISSRTLVRGWIGISAIGVFSLFPMVARILSPRRYGKVMAWLNDSILPDPRTELAFMREDEASHDAAEGLMQGFTVDEKVERLASVLGPAGLRKGMARLVLVLGHGSTSLNNPHESAYDCGACGGRRGGPNARIFAAMANHPAVREGLRERNIIIPEDTWFIGGYHDTCNCNIDLYDVEAMPETHRQDLERVRASLDKARALSAHERARRFEAASSSTAPTDALHHVQARAEHLAEPRPEYGHSSNAVCYVGRRSTTRGLFLDRRAFLVSYDALHDQDNGHLARVLGAVIPVCGGINLEYYFSYVDNERYGCGTKLPHNITGLVGVMNGAESDLRTGLTLQMVEIHEPVRILFVVETTPKRLLETVRKNPLLWEFVSNQWIRVAAHDPIDGQVMHVYRGGDEWEKISGSDESLAHAANSMSWYHGKQDHLPIARIGGSTEAAQTERRRKPVRQ